ncbi:MAG TPA: RNA polymerase factor sigma-54, partial [Alphaproteobacteria bacterium]|nr:RNA polymerase factor sigma-54 [Alphaproteobacteria bacterium]
LQEYIQDNPLLEMDGDEGLSYQNKPSKKTSDQDEYCQSYETYLRSGSHAIKDPFYKQVASIGLEEFVLSQIKLLDLQETDYQIALELLSYLNSDGRCEFEDYNLNKIFDSSRIEKVLNRLQTIEPTGIFARNLAECFKIQLEEKDLWSSEFEVFLDSFITNPQLKDVKKIPLSPKIIEFCLKELKKLDPFPLRGYGEFPHPLKTIDLIIREKEDSSFEAFINEETLPKIYLNSSYYLSLKNKLLKEEERLYLNKCYKEGEWLLRSLDQRYKNLLKIANALLTLQQDFFKKGIDYLSPMTLKDIATLCEVHESTVSRCFHYKYIKTPQGIFEMKYFLSRSIKTPLDGFISSSTTILSKLKGLLEKEDSSSPYSDQDLVDILKKEGFSLARRTVTKYREKLAIPPSSVRKNIYRVKGKVQAL